MGDRSKKLRLPSVASFLSSYETERARVWHAQRAEKACETAKKLRPNPKSLLS